MAEYHVMTSAAALHCPGDICEGGGIAPLCPELNLDVTVALFITTCADHHTGLQWPVSSYHRCCCISLVTLAKQDVDLKSLQVFLSFTTLVFLMGSYSSALIPDTEEFASIASAAEKLNEQIAGADERLQSELQTLATLIMEEKRKENQSEEPGASTLRGNSHEASHNGSALPAAGPKPEPTPSFSSLLPQVLSAVLPQGLSSDPRPSRSPAAHTSPSLGGLQTELRDLRDQFEQMKSQHNKEIKLLMSELDEEKRIRLTLQMEIQRMKKHMSK